MGLKVQSGNEVHQDYKEALVTKDLKDHLVSQEKMDYQDILVLVVK